LIVGDDDRPRNFSNLEFAFRGAILFRTKFIIDLFLRDWY